MRTKGAVLAGLLALGLAGCDYVTSSQPFGKQPIHADSSEWEGTWLNEEGALVVRVVDAGKGQLEVGWIEAEAEGLALETIEAHLREFEGDGFVSVGGLEDQEEVPGFLWLRLAREGEQLLLWLPDAESFRRLVEEGTLPGRLEEDGVVLGELSDQQLALIAADADGVLFDWREPMVLRRVRHE